VADAKRIRTTKGSSEPDAEDGEDALTLAQASGSDMPVTNTIRPPSVSPPGDRHDLRMRVYDAKPMAGLEPHQEALEREGPHERTPPNANTTRKPAKLGAVTKCARRRRATFAQGKNQGHGTYRSLSRPQEPWRVGMHPTSLTPEASPSMATKTESLARANSPSHSETSNRQPKNPLTGRALAPHRRPGAKRIEGLHPVHVTDRQLARPTTPPKVRESAVSTFMEQLKTWEKTAGPHSRDVRLE